MKCGNILVGDQGLIKISDFGASKFIDYKNNTEKLSYSLKGSPYWLAPEVLSGKGYSFPIDIWSIGCLTIEMLTGRPPWSDKYGKDTKKIL